MPKLTDPAKGMKKNGKDLTREERKAERLKAFKRPKTKAARDAAKQERINQ